MIALFVLLSTLGRPPALATVGPSAYLPPDGFRARFSNDTGSRASEWAIDQGTALAASGPAQLLDWLPASDAERASTLLARFATVRAGPTGQHTGRQDDFFTIGSDGLRFGLSVSSDGSSRRYSPGRLDLSPKVAAGAGWISAGKVTVRDSSGAEQILDYVTEFNAAPPASRELLLRRCVVITMRQQVGQLAEPPITRTWCPGLGIVTEEDAQGSWQATNSPSKADLAPRADFDWSTAERLEFSQHATATSAGQQLATPLVPPAILTDGTVVTVPETQRDALGVNIEANPAEIAWRVRAGARNTTSATFNDLTLIANTDRQLIAYDGQGRWLWRQQLTELSMVPPVRLGDLAVVTTADGAVTAYHLDTGAPAWVRHLGAEIRVRLQTSGDRVVVLDQAGELACIDITGTTVWSAEITPTTRLAISTGPDPVVVVPGADGSWAVGFSLADGRRLWRTRTPFPLQSAIGLDGQVVLRNGSTTTSLDAATGQTRWSWQGARTFASIGGGKRVLLLSADRLILLDDQGHRLRDWPVALGELELYPSFLWAADGRVLAFGPTALSLGVVQ